MDASHEKSGQRPEPGRVPKGASLDSSSDPKDLNALRMPSQANEPEQITQNNVDRAELLARDPQRIALGRTLQDLSQTVIEADVKFEEFDAHFKQSTKAMNGPMLEFAAWFGGGITTTIAVNQFSLPVSAQVPFYLMVGVGAARFLWRLAKEARPSGMAATESKQQYYSLLSKREGLAKAAKGYMQVYDQVDESGAQYDEDSVGTVLKAALEYVTPDVPYLQMNKGKVVGSINECAERLARVVVPRNPVRKEQLEAIVDGYTRDRARLLKTIGKFLQDPQGTPAGNIVHSLGRLSDYARELDQILVKRP